MLAADVEQHSLAWATALHGPEAVARHYERFATQMGPDAHIQVEQLTGGEAGSSVAVFW